MDPNQALEGLGGVATPGGDGVIGTGDDDGVSGFAQVEGRPNTGDLTNTGTGTRPAKTPTCYQMCDERCKMAIKNAKAVSLAKASMIGGKSVPAFANR